MVSRIIKQKHWLHCIWVLCLVWVGPLFAQTITLNLKDADINALIGTVAEVTGKNFIVDPRVKGKVTVISSRAMDSEEIYQVFLSILKVHGFAAVPSGAVIKILPDVSAKQDAIPSVDDNAPGRGDEMVTRVVQVDNVAAAQLVPILRPLVPQQGHLAAYPATNVLIMSDRAENVKRLVNIIRRIDKVSDSEIEVIRLEYASAAEVVRILTAISRAQPGKAKGAGTLTQALVADERTNSVLLGGDRSNRLRLRAIISHLDTPLERGGNTKVIYLKYATAADLVEVLRGVGKTQSEGVKKGAAATTRSIDKQLDIQADESTNALVITAPPALMRSLEAVIRQLDIRRAQVLVDAIIAEIGEGRARELGIQWAVFDLSGSTTPIGGTNFTNTGTSLTDIGQGIIDGQLVGLTPGLSFGLGKIGGNGVNFAAVVNALAGDSDVNILSTPSLVTLDNEEAEIIVGQNVPFLTGSFSNTGAATGSVNPFQTVQRQDVGITLKVKPQINEGDSIIMEITQEVSSISNDAQAVDLITNKRNIKTNVLVDNNHVVVLGGLIEDRVRESEQKVPLLGDIPFLGALFRSKSVNRDKVNLMVFLHPVILRDNKTADRYTGARYNYIRAMQLEKDNEGVPLMSGKGAPHIPIAEELLELPPLFEAPHPHAAPPAGKATGVDEQ
ncbi:MAG: type II secretion system secretin GspD [Gammaproteobacteria bacterium]|nr:MAG: type II secretion system secretin GspD [Gammaproteobacteria bacterium]